MVYIIAIIILLLFLTYELDLIHIKKNRSLYKSCFPLTKEKFCSLTEEENTYLYNQLNNKYKDTFKNSMLLCINKKADLTNKDYFILDKTNEDRKILNDFDMLDNLNKINKSLKGITYRLTGTRCTRSIKIFITIIIIYVIAVPALSIIF